MAFRYNKLWTTYTCRKYNNYLFIYGDNDLKLGKGGQAMIRDEPNVAGIPTKKEPNNKKSSFYTDNEYDSNVEKISTAIKSIKHKLNDYDGIIYPKDGIGTGLAQLDKHAPKTFRYLNRQLKKLFKYAMFKKQ